MGKILTSLSKDMRADFSLLWSSQGIIIVPIVLRETEVKEICYLCLLCAQQWDSPMLPGLFYFIQRDVPFNYKNIQIAFMYFLFINYVLVQTNVV